VDIDDEGDARAGRRGAHRGGAAGGGGRAGEESGPLGLTREVERPLPSNSPHDHMILRVDLVGSHGRWKRPCLQTAHKTI
jgi:hypothetical protein